MHLCIDIFETTAWARLQQHAMQLKDTHLRDLLADETRCAATTITSMDIMLDYSREKVTLQTMDMLFDLAEAAGFILILKLNLILSNIYIIITVLMDRCGDKESSNGSG